MIIIPYGMHLAHNEHSKLLRAVGDQEQLLFVCFLSVSLNTLSTGGSLSVRWRVALPEVATE